MARNVSNGAEVHKVSGNRITLSNPNPVARHARTLSWERVMRIESHVGMMVVRGYDGWGWIQIAWVLSSRWTPTGSKPGRTGNDPSLPPLRTTRHSRPSDHRELNSTKP